MNYNEEYRANGGVGFHRSRCSSCPSRSGGCKLKITTTPYTAHNCDCERTATPEVSSDRSCPNTVCTTVPVAESCVDSYPLAMAYVPMQQWRELYDPISALCHGTIFRELDLPWYPTNCRKDIRK